MTRNEVTIIDAHDLRIVLLTKQNVYPKEGQKHHSV